MTLILGCATKDFIVQVADRLITEERSRRPLDKDRNKSIFLQGRYVFSYSGPSEINGVNTNFVLARVLARPPERPWNDWEANPWLSAVTERLANVVPEGKKFALSGFGWINRPNGEITCAHIRITNAMDVDTGRWNRTASDQMFIQWNLASRRRPVMFGIPTGAHFDRPRLRIMQRLIENAAQKNRGPAAIAGYLVAELRRLATEDERIGSATIVMVHPKPSAEEFRELYAPMPGIAPRYDRPVCYLADSRGQLVDWSGPIFVYNGWALHLTAQERGADHHSVTAQALAHGEGCAGAFMDFNGVRHGILNLPGAVIPAVHVQPNGSTYKMIGLYCPAVEFQKSVPLPDISMLVPAQRYVVQLECAHCGLNITHKPEEAAAKYGWYASFHRIARRYKCKICGHRGASIVRACEDFKVAASTLGP